MGFLAALIKPLRSRKVRTALATMIAAYAAKRELDVGADIIFGIITVGTSIILGTAIEDHGAKSGALVPRKKDQLWKRTPSRKKRNA